MHFATAYILLAAASLASAATFDVKVGEGGLTYTPSSVTAAEGDVINFEFFPKNHTLTQSTFAKPCEAMSSPSAGIDSGYVPVAADATEHPVWSMTVNNASAPLWFYCAQGTHCVNGMVFAVNPTADKTFEAFQAAAMAGGAAGGASGSSGSAGASGSAGPTGASGSAGTAGSTAGAGGASASSSADAAGASQSAGASDGATSIGASPMLLVAIMCVSALL